MLINIHGAKCLGIEAVKVTVEVDISPGLGIHLHPQDVTDVALAQRLEHYDLVDPVQEFRTHRPFEYFQDLILWTLDKYAGMDRIISELGLSR